MSRRDLWKGLAIGVARSVVLTLLLQPETMARFAPVLVPVAVLRPARTEAKAMFADSPCRPTIAVRDKAKAVAFFGGVLGLRLVDENQPGATFECGSGTFLEIYPSAFAGTAQSTVAGFQVSDLETTMRELRSSGIVFEDYDSPKTVEGIAQLGPNRGAWFKDPDGNIFALVEPHSA